MKKTSRLTPYYLVILATVLITSFGCSDEFFNEKSGERITSDQHYNSLKDAQISMFGAIIPLQEAMPKLIMIDGLRSDMMDVTTYADPYLKELNDQVISLSNPYTNPADLYKVIVNINDVLSHLHEIADKTTEFDSFYEKELTGYLIGMRAWTYLTLARLYNQVAYFEDPMTTLPKGERNIMTKEVLLDTLISQVKTYVHTDTKLAEVYLGMVNTKGLLGELYLEKNDYANAAFYLKLACESYPQVTPNNAMLKVDKSYQNLAWLNIFLNAEGATFENIAVIPYSLADGQINILQKWIGYSNDYMVKPTSVLVDSLSTQESSVGVGEIYRGYPYVYQKFPTGRMINDTTMEFEYSISKYEMDASDPFSSDIIIQRAADIHLMLAEALNRLGGDANQKLALTLVNQGIQKESSKPAAYTKWSANVGIRGRVGLKTKGVPVEIVDPDQKTLYIEDLIMEERALELAFEGKRWSDLMRVAQRRSDPSYLANKVAAKFEAGSAQYNAVHDRLLDMNNWYLPFQ